MHEVIHTRLRRQEALDCAELLRGIAADLEDKVRGKHYAQIVLTWGWDETQVAPKDGWPRMAPGRVDTLALEMHKDRGR